METTKHEHVWTGGWIRDQEVFRSCKCGVYDNPWASDSDFPQFDGIKNENPFDWKP